MLTEPTRRRVFRVYLETLYRSKIDNDSIGGAALVMFAIAAVVFVVSLLS